MFLARKQNSFYAYVCMAITLVVLLAIAVVAFNYIAPGLSGIDVGAGQQEPGLVPVKIVNKPTLTITAMDRNGNIISDSGPFNMIGLAGAQFTVNVVNTEADSGWNATCSPIDRANLGLAAVTTPSRTPAAPSLSRAEAEEALPWRTCPRPRCSS